MTVILSTLIETYTANPVTHSCPSEFDQVSGKPWLWSLLSLGASSLYPKKKNLRKKKTNKHPDGLWGRKILEQVFHFQTSLSSTAGYSMWEDLGKSEWKLLTVKMIWFSGKWWEKAPPLLKKSSCGSIWSYSFTPLRGIFISDNSMKQSSAEANGNTQKSF